MASTNLVVPVVLWGPYEPTHCVSSVFLSRDLKTLATGCYDGQNMPMVNIQLKLLPEYSDCYTILLVHWQSSRIQITLYKVKAPGAQFKRFNLMNFEVNILSLQMKYFIGK